MFAPVTNDARGEQSQTISSATSSGVPICPIGCIGSSISREGIFPSLDCSASDHAFNPGIVAGTVDTAERLDRLLDQRLDILGLRHVGPHEKGLTTRRGNQAHCFLAALDIHVRHRDPGPLGCEHERRCAPDPRSGACNQRALSVDHSHDFFPFPPQDDS